MSMKREITRADIMSMADYVKVRQARRQQAIAMKKHRRVAVGPYATFHFENYETMWQQIHEMLYIEKGGEEQIADELRAYNPMIPKGNELTATMMLEIEDPVQRARVLSGLGGIEDAIVLDVGGSVVRATSEQEVERTKSDGKTSSVHFLHFVFTPEQIAKFRNPETRVLLGIEHQNYGHMAVLTPETRASLAQDFA